MEGLDEFLVHNVKLKHMPQLDDLEELPKGKGWLVVEFGGGSKEEVEQTAREAMKALEGSDAPSMKLYVDDEQQKKIWDLREAGLGATAFVPGQDLTWPGWEDSAVAPEKVGAYLRDFVQTLREVRLSGRSLRPLRTRMHSLPAQLRPDERTRNSQVASFYGRRHRSRHTATAARFRVSTAMVRREPNSFTRCSGQSRSMHSANSNRFGTQTGR